MDKLESQEKKEPAKEEPKLIFSAMLEDNGIRITIGTEASFREVSWAKELLTLEFQNRIISQQQKSGPVRPVMFPMLGRNKLKRIIRGG